MFGVRGARDVRRKRGVMNRPKFSYIAQCPKCGAYCEAVIDDPAHAKLTAKSIVKMIKSGLLVTHVDTEFVRNNFSGCTCKAEKQQKLF